MDADIGELEREIDEIAADVATMARVSAPTDSEGDRFSSAHSVATWTSRSAPDGTGEAAEGAEMEGAWEEV